VLLVLLPLLTIRLLQVAQEISVPAERSMVQVARVSLAQAARLSVQVARVSPAQVVLLLAQVAQLLAQVAQSLVQVVRSLAPVVRWRVRGELRRQLAKAEASTMASSITVTSVVMVGRHRTKTLRL
jgi:hypothetical protein